MSIDDHPKLKRQQEESAEVFASISDTFDASYLFYSPYHKQLKSAMAAQPKGVIQESFCRCSKFLLHSSDPCCSDCALEIVKRSLTFTGKGPCRCSKLLLHSSDPCCPDCARDIVLREELILYTSSE